MPFASSRHPPWLRLAEATRLVAPKPLVVPVLARKADLHGKVRVCVLHAEPITLKALGWMRRMAIRLLLCPITDFS
jgi:hypothetical protein